MKRSRIAPRLCVAVSFACGSAVCAPSLFDPPVKVVRVPLPRDPDNPGAKARVSCFYFPGFMVKEVDLGEVGAESLSITPAGGGRTPACRRPPSAQERVIPGADWSGYFDGVKGGYVFFSADDGWNGGMGFAVFRAADARKLFDDAAKTGFRSVRATPTGLALTYTRVYAAPCSLSDPSAGCWARIKQATGLAGAAPDCAAAYAREQKRTPAIAKQVLKDPTVIDYDVRLTVQGAAKTITPVTGNAITCRPAD